MNSSHSAVLTFNSKFSPQCSIFQRYKNFSIIQLSKPSSVQIFELFPLRWSHSTSHRLFPLLLKGLLSLHPKCTWRSKEQFLGIIKAVKFSNSLCNLCQYIAHPTSSFRLFCIQFSIFLMLNILSLCVPSRCVILHKPIKYYSKATYFNNSYVFRPNDS